MKKKTISVITILAVVVIAFVGVLISAGGKGGENSGEREAQIYLEETLPTTEIEAVLSAETGSCGTEATTETSVEEALATNALASPLPVESSVVESSADESSVYDPPFVKEYIDNSPEARLADLKESLAKEHAFAIDLMQQKQTLEAERAELLAKVNGKTENLTEAQSTELARIDAALEYIWLNHGSPEKHLKRCDYETYLLETIRVTKAESEWGMGFEEEGDIEYVKYQMKIEMADKMLEMYEDGADLDSIYLYYFERLNYIFGGGAKAVANQKKG